MTSCSHSNTKLRALVICTHVWTGRTRRRSRHFMQPITGLHIASRLDPGRFDVRLHHESWHGPFEGSQAAGFDVVFLTGLQPEFDRMRQLSYWFRRTGALVVAGGTICSLFPEFASKFFDVVCVGGVDAVADVARDMLAGQTKPIYRSAYLKPRASRLDHGLLTRAGIRSPIHFIEASRGCSFKCSFCVMPAEAGGHVAYAVDAVRAAIDDSIRTSPRLSLRRLLPQFVFLDNNFADDRAHLDAMLTMLASHRRVRAWSAMVTQNILADHALIDRMAASKCRQLFVGIESLDPDMLRRFNKKQNLGRRGVVDDVAYAEGLGIAIAYGYLLDPRHQTAAAIGRELRALAETPAMPLPLFISLVSPLAGTASFWECAANNGLAPNLRLRDLEGETIAYRALADDPAVLAAAVDQALRRPWEIMGRRRMVAKALLRLRHSRSWNPFRWWIALATQLSTVWASAYPTQRTTYMAGEDVLDPQYRDHPPDLTIEDRTRYFDPIAITDASGRIMPWLEPYAPAQSHNVEEAVR